MLMVMTPAILRYLIKSLQHHNGIGAIFCSTIKKRNLEFGEHVATSLGLHNSKCWIKSLNAAALRPQDLCIDLHAIQPSTAEADANHKYSADFTLVMSHLQQPRAMSELASLRLHAPCPLWPGAFYFICLGSHITAP